MPLSLFTKRYDKAQSIVYVGWLSIALFYFYQYILRVAPGVLVTDLRQTFQLTAEQFSTLGAFYLYAYSLCQIPLGLLVDRIGIRKTILMSIVCCLAGTFLMANAKTLIMLQLSRVLIGLGSAAAFMGALKMVVDYLLPGKRGFLMGATLTLGTLGALVAGKPLALAADVIGWRQAINYTGLIGIAILIFAYNYLPAPQADTLYKPTEEENDRHLFARIMSVFKLKYVMLYTLLAVGAYTPLSVLADLWGVAFLMQKYHLSRLDAATTSMMMYVGLGIGCLTIPWLSERYNILNNSIKFFMFTILIIFLLLLYGSTLPMHLLQGALLILGMSCSVEMLCFTGASYYTLRNNVGITLGVVNTLNMLGGGVLQQIIGIILDNRWQGAFNAEHIRLYTTTDYVMALSALLLVILICCVLSFLLPRIKNML